MVFAEGFVMSTLLTKEKRLLEDFFEMHSGYVLDFSNHTFREFVLEAVGIDIYAEKYAEEGFSKAKRLRTFWKLESDYTVGKLLHALIDYALSTKFKLDDETQKKAEQCRAIAMRLMSGGYSLDPLREHASILNASYLAEQVRRMEVSINTDPSLAIGTAKELIETYCKTILADRGKPFEENSNFPKLLKETLRELKLVPEGVPESARGAKTIQRILSNLGAIGNGLAELRNLYGTGHGKHGHTKQLSARHAKLAVYAAKALVTFLFETHLETKS